MWNFRFFNHTRRKFRYFIRRHMKPMSVDEAEEKREFFAKLYFLTAFFIFNYLLYKNSKQNLREVKGSKLAEATVERLKLDGNVRILNIEGFKKKEDYYYSRQGDVVDKDEKSDVESLVETEVLDYS